MTPELQRKVDFAIHLLQSIPQDGPIELCYSGGKDSDVILELAKMAGIPFEAIYKNTTIDPPGTIQHCKEKGVKIVQPPKSFYQLVSESGNPTRHHRFCCGVLKEYKIHDRAILGIRREESSRRFARYKEPEQCRVYSKDKKVRQYFPILEWTKADVEEFITERGVKCHSLYYDEDGKFHAERRLGCIGCPLQHDHGRSQYIKYPMMLRALARAMQKYKDTKPAASWYKHFGADVTIYKILVFHLFFDTVADFNLATGSGGGELFDGMELDYKKYLEDYFKIDLTL